MIENAIRELYKGKGVRKVSENSFEAFVQADGKFLSCGTYSTEEEAVEAVANAKIKHFEKNVIAHGEKLNDIIPCAERGYFVSKNGRVYNRHGRAMIGAIDRCGYRHIIINGKNKNIHRLVAETLIPNPKNLPCVNHKDGDKLNNSVDNLEWCTYSENTIHAYETGLEQKKFGEKNHTHKLTEDDVKYIRQVYVKRDKEYGASALAVRFNIDRTTIHDIVKRKTWGKVS